jgi:DNA-binding XRE family transcriptional regulator
MSRGETKPPKRPLSPRVRARRAALREELYARIARGDISLVEAVKMMRKIAGRSQADYARLVGVSPRILIELERGIGNPTMKTLAKILAPFDLEVGLRRRPR